MKVFFPISLLVLSWNFLKAQDTIYYDKNWNKISKEKAFEHYDVITHDEIDTVKANVKRYRNDNSILSDLNYSNYSKKTKDGIYREWYKNQQLKEEINYKEGKLNEKLTTFWSNGQLKRDDVYIEDSLIQGKVFDDKGIETEYFDFFIPATFPGGKEALVKFITSVTLYPRYCRKNNIEGEVTVKFIVEKDGKVTNVKVTDSIHELLDKESIKVVKLMPHWAPAKQDGETVRSYFMLPIRFQIE